MKKCILLISLLFLSNLSVYAKSISCNGTDQKPCIVQDTQNNSAIVKRWRAAPEIAHVYKGDTTGLDSLWMSGSAVPSAQGFKTITDNIKKITKGKVKTIIDVDLRQESHGYLNNNAITLATKHDWINKDKIDAEALEAERNWLASLKKQAHVLVLTPQQFKAGDFSKRISVPVQDVVSEETMAKKNGLHYFRLMVTDHMPPNNLTIDKFVALVDKLPPHTWLHIHCRGGAGRTTTFMVMDDMLKNASVVSFDDIMQRQASVKPFYNLALTERRNPKFNLYYQQRLQFLKKFYQFAKAHSKGSSKSWSEFIK